MIIISFFFNISIWQRLNTCGLMHVKADTKLTFMLVLQCRFIWIKALLWYKQAKLFRPMQHEWRRYEDKNQFHIHKVYIPHKESWQPACRASGTEFLLHFSLITEPFLMYFFTLDFSWLLSKHRSDTIPAVPPLPLKNSHWAFQRAITTINVCMGVCVCTV